MKVKEKYAEIWIAIPKRETEVGETVSFAQGMEMKDFKSKDLDRVFPSVYFLGGVNTQAAATASAQAAPMAGHKTQNYWPRIQALQAAATHKAGESLWFTVSNHLASGSVSNIFLIKDGDLLTPFARGEEPPGALGAPVLPGITRGALIELAGDMNIFTTKKMLDINDLLGADEVFLTNSSWGVLPVIGVEQEKIADGCVGDLTHSLREAWTRCVDEETYPPPEPPPPPE